MTQSRLALLLASLSLSLASCATLEREEVAAPPNGGNVVMRVGTPLVVSLPPDPATGSGWVLRSTTPNLQLVGGPDYTPAPKPPGLAAVADTTAYRFRAMSEGKGTVEFAWSAPPGAAPQPDKVVRYDVDIGPRLWLVTDVFGTVGLPSARMAEASSAAAAPVR